MPNKNYELVDGQSAPETDDRVRIRVLRGDRGAVAVNRPHRDRSLELETDTEVTLPGEAGTYEILGTVRRMMLAQQGGSDYLFLDEAHVKKISDQLVELEGGKAEPDHDEPDEEEAGKEHLTPEWKRPDPEEADVDIDVESVLSETSATERQRSTGWSMGEKHRRPNMNDLLLNE